MLFQSLILISLFSLIVCAHNKQEKDVKEKDTQQTSEYNPLGALVRYYSHWFNRNFWNNNHCLHFFRCNFLPMEFLECENLKDHEGNQTAKDELGYGCLKFGGSFFHEVERTKTFCTVLPEIECHGLRKFQRDGFPCVKYGDHYFLTTLLYSITLGFLGMDR